jgi:predicted nucleic acid-binding protein
LNSDFQRILRRLKPDKHRQQLQPRDEADLSFLNFAVPRTTSLLCDTTVYIDILQGRFPAEYEAFIRAADVWHSTVPETELAIGCALLDPAHSGTREVVSRIIEMLDRRPPHRILWPDREVYQEAGILTGTIARLQNLGKSERQRILNDALIFCTSRKFGHTVLTRNIADFDFLNQLDPTGRVLFYRALVS